ncbi:uncharacterized protein LOC121975068 isoform X2 [Zingiber officinale]|uniref:uncharacterized protein LOC121975068 isoform X2 n=1 Tax=Zingiber officinale TaxID=94328 RepID=UPI001C4ACEFF|nr:uncharacterized protein LOC121975068 isoform X2 [Zingiber officinale]
MSARPALNVAELGFEFEANPLTRWFGHSTFSTFEMESESEDDGLDMGDYDDVEEPENEPEAVRKEPTIEKPAPVSALPKDAERQLSKKELKKKEMAELDALLYEMGIANFN